MHLIVAVCICWMVCTHRVPIIQCYIIMLLLSPPTAYTPHLQSQGDHLVNVLVSCYYFIRTSCWPSPSPARRHRCIGWQRNFIGCPSGRRDNSWLDTGQSGRCSGTWTACVLSAAPVRLPSARTMFTPAAASKEP